MRAHMFFKSPDDEKRFCSQLVQIADIANHSIQTARLLQQQGLCLLNAEYGGLLDNSSAALDATLGRFEVELLKERYGTWTVFEKGESLSLGYRSSFLDELLEEAQLERDHLENLSRPEEMDLRILARPWALRYNRNLLEKWRSTSQRDVVNEEKWRECRALGLGSSHVMGKIKKHIELSMSKIVGNLGYEKSGRRYEKFKTVYTNANRITSGVAVELTAEVEVVPITGVPASVSLRFMPVLDISGANDFFVRCFQRGNFFKAIEPLVPNFGLYRVAWDEDQLELLLYAYAKFLAQSVPAIEGVCEGLLHN